MHHMRLSAAEFQGISFDTDVVINGELVRAGTEITVRKATDHERFARIYGGARGGGKRDRELAEALVKTQQANYDAGVRLFDREQEINRLKEELRVVRVVHENQARREFETARELMNLHPATPDAEVSRLTREAMKHYQHNVRFCVDAPATISPHEAFVRDLAGLLHCGNSAADVRAAVRGLSAKSEGRAESLRHLRRAIAEAMGLDTRAWPNSDIPHDVLVAHAAELKKRRDQARHELGSLRRDLYDVTTGGSRSDWQLVQDVRNLARKASEQPHPIYRDLRTKLEQALHLDEGFTVDGIVHMVRMLREQAGNYKELRTSMGALLGFAMIPQHDEGHILLSGVRDLIARNNRLKKIVDAVAAAVTPK